MAYSFLLYQLYLSLCLERTIIIIENLNIQNVHYPALRIDLIGRFILKAWLCAQNPAGRLISIARPHTMELYTRGNRITRPVVIACLILLSILILYFLVKSNKDGYTARYIKISQLLSASIHLSEKSGKQIVAIRKNEDPDIKVKGHTAEGAAEYVTMGDQKSHEIITEGLHSIWSDLRYRSEEKDRPDLIKDGIPLPSLYHSEVAQFLNRDEQVDVNNIVVWVDPLDATQEYTEGGENPALLEYVMVMVCIVVNDRPIASVMHQPFVTGNHLKALDIVLMALSLSLSLPPPLSLSLSLFSQIIMDSRVSPTGAG